MNDICCVYPKSAQHHVFIFYSRRTVARELSLYNILTLTLTLTVLHLIEKHDVVHFQVDPHMYNQLNLGQQLHRSRQYSRTD